MRNRERVPPKRHPEATQSDPAATQLPFTVPTLRTLSAPADAGRVDIYDADGPPGFGIRVGKRTKSFFVWTRSRTGRSVRKSLGQFPKQISLKDARKRAEEIRSAHERPRDRQDITFGQLRDRFLSFCASSLPSGAMRPRTEEMYRITLNATPDEWDGLLAEAITRADVKVFLAERAARHPHQANRTRGALHRLYGWGLEMELVDTNPVIGTKRPGFGGKREPRRERVLSHEEIRGIWTAISKERPTTQAALRMLFYTGLRKSEVLSAEWSHVDLEAGIWRVPAVSTKSRMRLDVPITEPMRELFSALRPFSAHRALVFSSFHHDDDIPIVLGAKIVSRLKTNSKTTGWRLHDIRRTVATSLSEMGVRDEILRALLGHTTQGALAHYQHGKFSAEKRDALERWAEKISRIVSGEKAKLHHFAAHR